MARLRCAEAALKEGREGSDLRSDSDASAASPDRRGVRAAHPVQIALSGGKKDMQAKASGPTFFIERSLAAYLAVSDRTVRNWIRRGELPSYKLGASRRIDPADVKTFLEQRREEAA